MSKPEALAMIHELESYGLVVVAADDDEISEALTELAMAEDNDD